MSEPTQADRYLLEQIRKGDARAWQQLVERYQGRLLAFSRTRSANSADAEDLVQETFLKFLNGLPAYREEANLETYLFMILRRRIIDSLRGKRVYACIAQEEAEENEPPQGVTLAAGDLTASQYVRRDEQVNIEKGALAGALLDVINTLKKNTDLQDLLIMEMLFYAQLRNKEIARLSGLDEKAIALIKHRRLKQLRDRVAERMDAADLSGLDAPGAADSMLTEVWEEQRPSCPKRSTLGGYLLKTLEKPWQEYVEGHVNKLGCRFCRANLDDLKAETKQAPRAFRDRVMQSTVGFLRR
jgi:RNA polymerase sigma factor (sigma-70 family)